MFSVYSLNFTVIILPLQLSTTDSLIHETADKRKAIQRQKTIYSPLFSQSVCQVLGKVMVPDRDNCSGNHSHKTTHCQHPASSRCQCSEQLWTDYQKLLKRECVLIRSFSFVDHEKQEIVRILLGHFWERITFIIPLFGVLASR